MPQLIIHTEPAKDYYFFKPQVFRRVRSEENNFVVLLPVKRAVRYFRQQLLEISPRKILADPPVFTFDDLLLKIYRQLPGCKRVINNDHFFLLLQSILKEHSQQFPYLLKNGTLTFGLVKKISDILSELRRFGYSYNAFLKIDPAEKEKNPLKFNDFEHLLQILEKSLGERLIDESFARHEAARLFTQGQLKQILFQPDYFYISGYGLFTPAMFRFIDKVRTFAEVHIRLDYNKLNRELFGHVQPAIKHFTRMGAKFSQDTPAGDLDFHLFNRNKNETVPIDFSQRISVQPLADRTEEVNFMAASIRDLHFKKHIPLSRIAVTFPNLERYVLLIRRIFAEYDLPFNLSTGFNLDQSPLIRLFLGALYLIRNRFEFSQTLAYFQSYFIPKKNIFDRVLLQNFFVEIRLKNLLPGWYYRATAYLSEKQKTNTKLLAQLKWLNEQLQIFYLLPEKASVQNIRENYINCLSSLGLLHWFKLENLYLSERQRENEFRVYNRFMKLFEKVVWILNYIYEDKALSLAAFTEFLEAAVARAVYNLTEWPDYGVQIMPRLEVLSLNPEILFLGGLVDGEFPRSSVKDVFFNDALREKLGLTAAEELLEQDRFIFYTLLSSSADKIILTYPLFEEERALVPSTFLSDLNETAKIQWAQEAPLAQSLLSLSGLWLNLGRDIQLRQFGKAAEKALLLSTYDSGNRPRLKSLFQRIAHSYIRIAGNDFFEYEGNLSAFPQIVSNLKKHYAQHSWSASRLEKYAFCPLSYFLNFILGIEEASEIEEEITPLERGLLVHNILEKFYSTLAKKNQARNPLAHRDLFLEIAENAFRRLPYRGLLWELERSVFFDTEEEAGLLSVFLNYDQQQINESGFTPSFFEYGFGVRQGGEDVELKTTHSKLRLEGRIDRIDLNDKKQALIFDYKTGTSKAKLKPQHILEGLHLQLPLYLLALGQILPDIKPLYAAFYLVKDANNCKRSELLADAEELTLRHVKKQAWLPNNTMSDVEGNELSFDDFLQKSLEFTIAKTEQLKSGIFRPTHFPQNELCQTHCPYKRICQKTVAKIKRIDE